MLLSRAVMRSMSLLVFFAIEIRRVAGFASFARNNRRSSGSWIRTIHQHEATFVSKSRLHVSTVPRQSVAAVNLTDSVPFNLPIAPWTFPPDEPSDPFKVEGPSLVEFVPAREIIPNEALEEDEAESSNSIDGIYPFVNMLRGSATYIADHRDEVAVFHIPGEFIEKEGFSELMDDIALSWLLGLKIVIVLGCRFDQDVCPVDSSHGHECRNALHAMDDDQVHLAEEEAGYVRFEVERQLNRRLRLNGSITSDIEHSPAPDGNVVSGNFYTAKPFGVVNGVDYKNTGLPQRAHVEKIQQVHENNDIVLLTTVGTGRHGELVNINGDHLAAFVAASLGASKLIYYNQEGTALRSKTTQKHLQDIPLSFAKTLVDHHNVQVHKGGFASFEQAQQALEPSAVEMLLQLGWSTWALENGVKRAHIVGPSNGALLEELYSATDGANTCIIHDNESQDSEEDDAMDINWDDFPTFKGSSQKVEQDDNILFVPSTPPYS